jgi:hypothetical protein
MAVDPSGNVLLTGSFGARIGFGNLSDADGGSTALTRVDQPPSLFVAALHSDGTPIFDRAFSPSTFQGGNVGGRIASDGSGGSVVVNSFFPGHGHGFVVTKLDATGHVTFQYSYAGASVGDVLMTPSGTILIVGTGEGPGVNLSAPRENPSALDPTAVLTPTTYAFPFLLELTKAGAYVRSRTLSTSAGLLFPAYARGDATGNLYFGGTIQSGASFSTVGKAAVAKFDSAGAGLWVSEFTGSSGSRTIGGIAASSNGDLVVTGGYQGSLEIQRANSSPFASFGPASSSDLFVAQFHTDGTLAGAGKVGGTWAQFGAGAAIDPKTNEPVIAGFDGAREDTDAPGYEFTVEVTSPPVVLRLPAKNAFASASPPVDTSPPAHVLGQYDELPSAESFSSGTLFYRRVTVEHPAVLSGFGWITSDEVPADKDTSVVFGIYTDDWSGAVPYSPAPESLVFSTGPVPSNHAAGRFDAPAQSCVPLAPGYYWIAVGWLHDRQIEVAEPAPYGPDLPLLAAGTWPTTTPPDLPSAAEETSTARQIPMAFYALTEPVR